jgi:hypothetical protein
MSGNNGKCRIAKPDSSAAQRMHKNFALIRKMRWVREIGTAACFEATPDVLAVFGRRLDDLDKLDNHRHGVTEAPQRAHPIRKRCH